MAPASSPLQIRGRAGKVGQSIEIGQVGADDESCGAKGGSSAQSAPGESGADESVADRIYSSLASKSS